MDVYTPEADNQLAMLLARSGTFRCADYSVDRTFGILRPRANPYRSCRRELLDELVFPAFELLQNSRAPICTGTRLANKSDLNFGVELLESCERLRNTEQFFPRSVERRDSRDGGAESRKDYGKDSHRPRPTAERLIVTPESGADGCS